MHCFFFFLVILSVVSKDLNTYLTENRINIFERKKQAIINYLFTHFYLTL